MSRSSNAPTESDPHDLPELQLQRNFWDEWNQSWRFCDTNDDMFMVRQREMAVAGRSRKRVCTMRRSWMSDAAPDGSATHCYRLAR